MHYALKVVKLKPPANYRIMCVKWNSFFYLTYLYFFCERQVYVYFIFCNLSLFFMCGKGRGVKCTLIILCKFFKVFKKLFFYTRPYFLIWFTQSIFNTDKINRQTFFFSKDKVKVIFYNKEIFSVKFRGTFKRRPPLRNIQGLYQRPILNDFV